PRAHGGRPEAAGARRSGPGPPDPSRDREVPARSAVLPWRHQPRVHSSAFRARTSRYTVSYRSTRAGQVRPAAISLPAVTAPPRLAYAERMLSAREWGEPGVNARPCSVPSFAVTVSRRA